MNVDGGRSLSCVGRAWTSVLFLRIFDEAPLDQWITVFCRNAWNGKTHDGCWRCQHVTRRWFRVLFVQNENFRSDVEPMVCRHVKHPAVHFA